MKGAVYANGVKVGDVIDVQWHPSLRHYEEEQQMNDVTLAAPRNPYRTVDGMRGEYAELAMPTAGPFPRRHDGDGGPGLTAGDLDRMVRQHFLDGYAKAEREGEEKIEAMRADLARAYDEGYTAGRVERAVGLAKDVLTRLLGPQMKVIEARGAIKPGASKAGDTAREGFDAVERELNEVREFVAALMTPHDPAAPARAAAQVARDEPASTDRQ